MKFLELQSPAPDLPFPVISFICRCFVYIYLDFRRPDNTSFFDRFGTDGRRYGLLVGVHWLCRR